MPRFSLLRPLDQPTGGRRLLHDLQAALDDDRFTENIVHRETGIGNTGGDSLASPSNLTPRVALRAGIGVHRDRAGATSRLTIVDLSTTIRSAMR